MLMLVAMAGRPSAVSITAVSAVYQDVLLARVHRRFGHLPGAVEKIARIRDDLVELVEETAFSPATMSRKKARSSKRTILPLDEGKCRLALARSNKLRKYSFHGVSCAFITRSVS